MIPEQFIKKFASENISLILSKKYDKKKIKNAKRKYFIDRLKNKFGVPKNSEIVEILIKQFISIEKIKDFNELDEFITNHPFLRDNIYDVGRFEQYFEEEKIDISPEEIKKLKMQETYEDEKQKLKEKILHESTKEIQEEIDKKMQEYLSLPSIIDNIQAEEPIIENVIIEDENIEWWERFNLVKNPFKEQEGLSQTSEDLYDKIVLKTPIFETYMNRVRNNPDDLLYKATPLLGIGGCGKTTLTDYLEFYSKEYRIKFIRISPLVRADVFSLNINFENSLFEEVKDFYKERFGYDYSAEPSISSVIDMLRLLEQHEGWKLIIVIDDLHKIIGGEKVVMDFIASLQIIKSKFNRKGIKVGFIVPGILEWKKYLDTSTTVRGFLDGPTEYMPDVTPVIAYEALKLRFKAFSRNPDVNNFIDLNFLKQIYRKTKNEGFEGFRTFMSNIQEELMNRKNFSIFESNPLDIPKKKLESIRDLIEKNESLKASFNKYVFGSGIQAAENRDLGLRILIEVYLRDGILDTDDFVKSNVFHIKNLANSNLINKVELEDKNVMLIVNPVLIKINAEILSTYNYSMEDYLRPIYSLPFQKRKKSEPKKSKDHFDEFIDNNKSGLVENLEILQASLTPYRRASGLDLYSLALDQSKELIGEWNTSLYHISNCIFNLENLFEASNLTPDNLHIVWSNNWNYPDRLKQYNEELERVADSLTIDKIPLIRGYYLEAYKELFEIFIHEYDVSRNFHLSMENLKDEEIKLFLELRKYFIEPYKKLNYFTLVKKLNEYLEGKIRSFLLLSMNVLYGERKRRLSNIKDNDIVRYIQNDPRLYENPSYNEFENLNRGQYKKIFLQNPNLQKVIFRKIFGIGYRTEFEFLLEVFADYNIITSHLKKESVTGKEQSKIRSYIEKAHGFINNINTGYVDLLDRYFYIAEDQPNCKVFYFSYQGLKNDKIKENICELEGELLKSIESLKPIEIDKNDTVRVFKIMKKISNELDLENYVFIRSLFGIEYRRFLGILAYLKYKNIIDVKSKFGTKVQIEFIKKGS